MDPGVMMTRLLLLIACAPLAFGQQPLTARYCAGCHNDGLKSGGLSFARLDASHPERDPAEWEKVISKLRAGMMPPSGAPRPDAGSIDRFASSIVQELENAAAPYPNTYGPA